MIRFLVRSLALTGLLLAVCAAIGMVGQAADWNLTAELAGEQGPTTQVIAILLTTGFALAAIGLIIEVLSGAQISAGRRSALGVNVIAQVLLALALLVGVNVWSFFHYQRWDCTREGTFTLKKELKDELSQLRGETTVVVYQMHKTFGRLSEKPPDEYDNAAEAKVVEKVYDLVDQLRELGSRFRVVVLDVQHKDKKRKQAEVVKQFPKLAEAIDGARESCIFFCAGDHVQRLGFNEFYQLDKTGSQEANGGRGNLALFPQGVEPFARRVLAVEEKRPRVAIAVSHPWLSTEGPSDQYALSGLKKTYTDYGFEVRDIVLRKVVGRGRGRRMENSALTMEESKYDQLEAQILPLRAQIQRYEMQRELFKTLLELMKSTKSNEEVTKELQLRRVIGPGAEINDEARKVNIERLAPRIDELSRDVTAKREKLTQRERDLDELQTKERVIEGQRTTDLKKKMTGLLAECDLLIIARMTLRDVGNPGVNVPNEIHAIDEDQLGAIKAFLKAGKPVFFCCGPPNDLPESGAFMPPDNLELLLTELGFAFVPQTVLFDSESDTIAASQVISFGRAGAEDIPPVDFPEKVATGTVQTSTTAAKPNPLAQSMRLMQRSAGQPLEVRMRHPRPIYYQPVNGPAPFENAFILTASQAWNEDQPFPTDDRPVPQFERPKPDDPSKKQEDPTKGTRLERRRGPFPIGVAVETKLPVAWYNERYGAEKAALFVGAGLDLPGGLPLGVAAESLIPTESLVPKAPPEGFVDPKTARVAVIGHGGWFAGPKLSAADETLLLNTTNWLLKRDDRLPRDQQKWQYPRVDLSERDQKLWRWGTFLGLPCLFAYLGMVVLMVRRIR